MSISAPIVAKTLGGLIAIGTGVTSIYFGNDYFSNINSKYDKALINFLNTNDNDIVFSIKKGDSDFNASDLDNLSTSANTQFTVSINVQIPQTAQNTFFSGSNSSNDAQLKEIKDLNSRWEWECQITFKNKGDKTSMADNYKDSIFKDNDKGLFGLLKRKISDITETSGNLTKSAIRKIKSEFINKCGSTRGWIKNKEINKNLINGNKIITEVPEFNFVNGSGGNHEKLVPEGKDFSFWFKEDYYTKI